MSNPQSRVRVTASPTSHRWLEYWRGPVSCWGSSSAIRRPPAEGSGATCGTSPTRPCPTGPRLTSLRLWRRLRESASSGSPATLRSPTVWPRSWRPGSAARSRSSRWSHERHSPTSAPSWSAMNRRRGWPRWQHGDERALLPASSWPACRRSSSERWPLTTSPRHHSACAPALVSAWIMSWALSSSLATNTCRRWAVVASSPAAVASLMSSRRASRCRCAWNGSATRSIRCVPSTRPTSAVPARSSRRRCYRPASSSWGPVSATCWWGAWAARWLVCPRACSSTSNASAAAPSAMRQSCGVAISRRARPSTTSAAPSGSSTNPPT